MTSRTHTPSSAGDLRPPAGSAGLHVHVDGPTDRFPPCGGKFAAAGDAGRGAAGAVGPDGHRGGVIVHALAAGGDNEVTLDAAPPSSSGTRRDAAEARGEEAPARRDLSARAGFRGGAHQPRCARTAKPVSSGDGSLDDLLALAPRLHARGWHVQLWVETGDLRGAGADPGEDAVRLRDRPYGRTMADKGVDTPRLPRFLPPKSQDQNYWCKLLEAPTRNTAPGRRAGCRL